MTLTPFPFTTSDLFQTVRDSHLTNRGFFAAHDTALDIHYVICDAIFYDLEVFRHTGSSFETEAQAACNANTRAVINGQYFHGYWDESWEGEVIDNSVVIPGNPPSEPDWRYIGKWAGRTAAAYGVGRGDPSTAAPAFAEAIGKLLPLVWGKIPFGAKTVTTSGVVRQYSSPVLSSTFFSAGADLGKVIYGIHRSTNLLFFIAQADGASPGIDMQVLIAQLISHGVDDAVTGDGSNSAALVVDGVLEVDPAAHKDGAMHVGLQLTRQTLNSSSGETVFLSSTYPALTTKVGTFPKTFAGASGRLTWGTSGIEVRINSLGTGITAAHVGLAAFPVTLQQGSGTDPTGTILWQDSASKVFLSGRVSVTGPTDPGTFSGHLVIVVSGTEVINATVRWTLA